MLDIGAGYGNNTDLLLAHGCRVIALETNPDAVAALQHRAAGMPAALRVAAVSADAFVADEPYDAVVCCMVLHFLEGPAAASRMIGTMKSWTKPGGYNVVTSYLQTAALPDEYSCLLQPDELRNLYHGWDILWYEESYPHTLRNVRSSRELLRILRGRRGYKAARILARKPR